MALSFHYSFRERIGSFLMENAAGNGLPEERQEELAGTHLMHTC